MWLYYIETYGYKKAETLFKKDYVKEKGVRSWVYMENVLEGKLLYLKMVKGEQDPTYLKLQDRFNEAFNKDFGLDIEKLLQVWEAEGIEKAEMLYKEMLATKRALNNVLRNSNIVWTMRKIEKQIEIHRKSNIRINTAISHPKTFQKLNPKNAQIFAFLDPEYYEKVIAPQMQKKVLK